MDKRVKGLLPSEKDNHCPADHFSLFLFFLSSPLSLFPSPHQPNNINKKKMTAVLSDLEQFIELRPGLFRCTVILQVGPLALPVATFLIRGNPIPDAKDAHEWIMVDAGLPNRTSVVLSAMDKLLCHPGDTLKYLCITHAHLDHTGATMLLLEKYPSMKVISHIEEKPFLCEGKSFRSCVGDTWTFNIMKNLSAASKVQVPEERLLLLREGEEWEYSSLVKVIETHGHTPGKEEKLLD